MSCRWALAAVIAVAACGGRARPAPAPPRVDQLPVPSVHVGECATPERDGVVSERPRREAHPRDLDGDGVEETIVTDRALCTDGNCYWNVFVRDTPDGCERFAGALAGVALEPVPGTARWPDIRTYWGLGGPRMLVHTYEFRRGGYLLTDVLLCRKQDDDRLLCTETE